MAVEIARRRNSRRTLIIAPASTFDGWYNHVKWQTGQTLRWCANQATKIAYRPDPNDRETSVEVKISKADAQAFMAFAQNPDVEGWFFVSREMLAREGVKNIPHPKAIDKITGQTLMWNKARTGPLMVSRRTKVWKNFDVAVYDECQMVANPDNKSRDSWVDVDAKFKIAQSADWFGNKLENMRTIAMDLWPNTHKMTKATFMDRYLTTEFDPFSYDKKKVTGEIWPGEFASTLPCYVAMAPAFAQPEPEEYYIDLSTEQMRLYKDLEKNLVAELESGELIVVDYKMHLTMRLRELALGVFRPDGETVQFVPGDASAKLDAARRIMADYPGEPFIIFTHSAKFAAKAAADLGGELWAGSVSKSERDAIKERFMSGQTKIIVATEAIAEGIDGLQTVCRNMIRLSPVYSELKNRQVIGRIARRGQLRSPNVWDVVARGTVDVGILPKLRLVGEQNQAAKSLADRAVAQ